MSLHISARAGEIAETVLLPGDPLRAAYVAKNLLEDAQSYNQIRGMHGFTGFYKGKRVSVQGAGMGIPSNAIYIHELITEYKVQNLIRIGTCGAIQEDIPLGRIILATAASTDSNINRIRFEGLDFAPAASFGLLRRAHEISERLKLQVLTGSIFSTDSFYQDDPNRWKLWSEYGILGVEMETSILYTMAARHKVNALSILTVSDNIITGAAASSRDREEGFTEMMKIALELAL